MEIERLNRIINAKKMCEELSRYGIEYEWCIKHPEVLGCDDSRKYYKRYETYIGNNYCICKNLLIQERKGTKRHFLIILPDDKLIDLKEEKARLKTSKLEFASIDKMYTLLNTTPGNVSIFNILYDKENVVELLLDKDIFKSKLVAFHPLYNGMSVFIKPEDIFTFLISCHKKYQIEEIAEKPKIYIKK